MEHIIKASHEHAEACETVHRMHKTLQKAQKIMEVATAEIGRALSEDALGRACYFFTECIEAVHQGMMTSWDDTLLEAPEWTKFRLLFPIARKLGQRTPDGTKAALAGLMAIRDKAGFFRVGHVKLSHSQTESAELVLELALRLWLHYRRHGATKARWHEMFRLFGRCRYGMERDIGRHRHSNREHRLERCVHFFEDVETMRHEVQDIRRTLRNPSVNGKKKGLPGELIEQVLSYLYPLDTGRNILISDKALAIAYSPWPVRRRRRDLRVSRDDWEAHSAAESVCLGERHELPLLELPGYAVSTCPALTRPIWEAGRRQFVHKHILSPRFYPWCPNSQTAVCKYTLAECPGHFSDNSWVRSPCTLLGEDHWGKDMSEQLSIRDPLTAEKCCGQHRWGSEIDLRWSLDHEVERHREHRRKYAEVDDAVLSSDDESILSTPSSCMPSDYTSEGELGPDSDSDYWS